MIGISVESAFAVLNLPSPALPYSRHAVSMEKGPAMAGSSPIFADRVFYIQSASTENRRQLNR